MLFYHQIVFPKGDLGEVQSGVHVIVVDQASLFDLRTRDRVFSSVLGLRVLA